VTQDLVIKNNSPFELNYRLKSIIAAEANHVGGDPFTLTPATGLVKGNESKVVKVTFRPHRPLALFREKILVDVPNQKEPTYVYLYGHCFHYQTYAIHDLSFGAFGAKDIKRPCVFQDALAVGFGRPADPDGAANEFAYRSAQEKNFVLTFQGAETSKSILVGAAANPGHGGAPAAPAGGKAPAKGGGGAASYDFTIEAGEFAKYFAVDAGKGPLAAGEAPTKITFKYNPPADDSLKCADMELSLLGGIGQWISCRAKGVLAGGVIPESAGAAKDQTIFVELRAYLQQI
jgi:hypothetical protein